MELGSENNGKHFATHENRKKVAKIADFFHYLCDAITDVIFFMCIDAILGAISLKKKNVRFDAISIAMRLPSLVIGLSI